MYFKLDGSQLIELKYEYGGICDTLDHIRIIKSLTQTWSFKFFQTRLFSEKMLLRPVSDVILFMCRTQ